MSYMCHIRRHCSVTSDEIYCTNSGLFSSSVQLKQCTKKYSYNMLKLALLILFAQNNILFHFIFLSAKRKIIK